MGGSAGFAFGALWVGSAIFCCVEGCCGRKEGLGTMVREVVGLAYRGG